MVGHMPLEHGILVRVQVRQHKNFKNLTKWYTKGMKAIWENQIIAESDETVVIEGNHYFPQVSVKKEFLKDSDHTSICPWKGDAKYYHVEVDGKQNENAAWYYPVPEEESVERVGHDLANYVAFWNGWEITL